MSPREQRRVEYTRTPKMVIASKVIRGIRNVHTGVWWQQLGPASELAKWTKGEVINVALSMEFDE